MGRNKHNALATAAAGRSVKERHQRSARDNIIVPRNLAALPEKNIKSKHQSYFQFFENKDRKDKKLEFQVSKHVPPSPLGPNVHLTHCRLPPIQTPLLVSSSCPAEILSSPRHAKSCHESKMLWSSLYRYVWLSNATYADRTILLTTYSHYQGAKDAHNHDDDNIKKLALHVHRMGHHIRQTIVEQAKALVGKEIARTASDNWQLPETQEEINAQAEAALRDLFPRIPNFDKQMIIEHSFKKVCSGHALPTYDIILTCVSFRARDTESQRLARRTCLCIGVYNSPSWRTFDIPIRGMISFSVKSTGMLPGKWSKRLVLTFSSSGEETKRQAVTN